MKKTILTALLLALSISTQGFAETIHGTVSKITDYLYKVTYGDYDYADFLEVHPKAENLNFACSGVHNGQFFGRNFDFYYNDTAQFVLDVPAKKGRFASIGVAYSFSSKNFESMTEADYQILPWAMLDGINENGVAVSCNVCPANDLNEFIAKDGTNPKKEKMCLSTIVRYILDNAKSATHAVKLLQKKNIVNDMVAFFPNNTTMLNFGYHFMITDLKKNYIVEFVNNKMQVTDKEPVMTNFFNTLPDYTPHASGIERYNLLKANYDLGGESMDSMGKLMKMVQFSQCYDPKTQPIWFSDLVGYYKDLKMDVTNDIINHNEKVKNCAIEHMKNTKFVRNGENIWQTQSTSIYDLKNLKLRLFVQENYDKYYEYEL